MTVSWSLACSHQNFLKLLLRRKKSDDTVPLFPTPLSVPRRLQTEAKALLCGVGCLLTLALLILFFYHAVHFLSHDYADSAPSSHMFKSYSASNSRLWYVCSLCSPFIYRPPWGLHTEALPHWIASNSTILRMNEFSREINHLLFNYRPEILTAIKMNEPGFMSRNNPRVESSRLCLYVLFVFKYSYFYIQIILFLHLNIFLYSNHMSWQALRFQKLESGLVVH